MAHPRIDDDEALARALAEEEEDVEPAPENWFQRITNTAWRTLTSRETPNDANGMTKLLNNDYNNYCLNFWS